MAVVVIMGLLMGIVGTAVFSQIDKARVNTTRAQIDQLEAALTFYQMDNGRFRPPTRACRRWSNSRPRPPSRATTTPRAI
jgi:type II secretory pathway pseudopilin PulG